MGHVVRLAVVLAAIPGCGTTPETASHAPTMFRGDPAHTGVYRTRDLDGPGALLWTFETGGAVRSSPVVVTDMVVVGSSDGHVYALDRHTGELIWNVDAGAPVNSTPGVASGTVVFGSRDGVYHAVDLTDGALRWQLDTGQLIPWPWGFEGWDYYTSSPVIQDSIVVFGAGDGLLYALHLLSGREIWRFRTHGRIRSSPAISSGVVYVGSADGFVYAVDLSTGQERWRFESRGATMVSADLGVDRRSIIGSPAVDAERVYIGSRDGFMYALDRPTGELQWRASHQGSWAMSSAALANDRVFSGTSDGRFVHALDAETGLEQWRFVAAGYTWSSPAFVDGTLYIGDGGGYLRAFNAHTGTERWNYRVGGGILSSPTVSDGTVFFGSDDGNVYALGADGSFPARVVFWDEAFAETGYFQSHRAVRLYLEDAGYRTLAADSLAAFMTARITDRGPSVIVFAIDHVPASLARSPSDTTLFRRYLNAGGKVVWLGLPPMILDRDPETGQATALDRSRTTALLDVDYSTLNFDAYSTRPTELGRAWGLSAGHVSWFAIDPSNDIEVLALDENGRAGIWAKNYGGPSGTGFVALGMERMDFADLDVIRTLAEY